MRFSPRPLLSATVLLLSGLSLPASDDPVSVSTQIFNGYTRTRLPDKSFQPEFYVFGEGGCWTRPVADSAMDRLKFPQIARLVAGTLARMNYLPAQKSDDAGLLILVFWGSTDGSASPANRGSLGRMEQDMLDDRNARILGYTDAASRAQFAPHMSFAQDILAEVRENRFYVVLQAYDFKTAVKERRLKPLWITRLSLSESGDFVPALEQMLARGARYFGQDTDGLRRHLIREGTVTLGPLEEIEVVPSTERK